MTKELVCRIAARVSPEMHDMMNDLRKNSHISKSDIMRLSLSSFFSRNFAIEKQEIKP